jgi:hypothetical protein
MRTLQKEPTHRQRHPRRRHVILHAVERIRLRCRRWKHRPELGECGR